MSLHTAAKQIETVLGKEPGVASSSGRLTYRWGSYTNRGLVVQLEESNSMLRYGFSYRHNKDETKKQEFKNQVDALFQDHLEELKFTSNTSGRCAYYAYDADELLVVVQKVHSLFVEQGYFEAEDTAAQGVSFKDTQFARLKERGATMSPMFVKLVCDASGMNLFQMQAEYQHLSGGQIDGVEFNEHGQVISLYECQSGIHDGDYLDDDHANKIISQYFLGDHHTNTVKKFVLLAGGYRQKHRDMFQQWIALHPDKEIHLLQTTREGNVIGIESVDVFKAEDPTPRYLASDTELIEITDILDRLDNLQSEQLELKEQLKSFLEKQQSKRGLVSRLFNS